MIFAVGDDASKKNLQMGQSRNKKVKKIIVMNEKEDNTLGDRYFEPNDAMNSTMFNTFQHLNEATDGSPKRHQTDLLDPGFLMGNKQSKLTSRNHSPLQRKTIPLNDGDESIDANELHLRTSINYSVMLPDGLKSP